MSNSPSTEQTPPTPFGVVLLIGSVSFGVMLIGLGEHGIYPLATLVSLFH